MRDRGLELRSEVEKSGRLPKYLKSHNLYELADKLGLQPDERTEFRLLRFSRFAKWMGRYPVPLGVQEYWGDVELSSGKKRIASIVTTDEYGEAHRLLDWIECSTGLYVSE